MIKNFKKGFTLIELLVVVSIISLLSSVVLSSIADARDKAAIEKFKEDYRQIANALELYKNTEGEYPQDQVDVSSLINELSGYIESGVVNLGENINSFGISNVFYNPNPYQLIPVGDPISYTCGSYSTGGYAMYFITLQDAGSQGFYNLHMNGSPQSNQYCTHIPPQ
jgi:prepilin-type N-terminal cleavage/methylation domain-containing protein